MAQPCNHWRSSSRPASSRPRDPKSTRVSTSRTLHLDQNGALWATLEGEEAQNWRARYPGRTLPRRKAQTLREALKLQRQLIDSLKSGIDPNVENPTLAEWVTTWIDGKQKLTDSTITRYRQLLKWQIEPHRIGRLRLRQVTHEHVEAWIRALKAEPRQDDDDRTLDPHTIARAFGLLRAALNTAVERGKIGANPCKGTLTCGRCQPLHTLSPNGP